MSKKKHSVALNFFKELLGPDYQHVPKYVAYVGMAVIIKDVIGKFDDIKMQVSKVGKKLDEVLPLLPWEQAVKLKPEKVEEMLKMPQSEFWTWLSAFTFAYLIVENFDALLALGGNLVGAVKLLAGL